MNDQSFSKNLLSWYFNSPISFPWRKTKNPYKIWLSEIMLQQTRATTVIPYYENWILKFPTLNSVSNSSLDDVLKAWEGLGYYARVRNFHKACKIVKIKFNSQIPKKFSDLIQLPGIGDYIASAVLSIAFNKPRPAIDVNVVRIISRLNCIQKPYPSSKNDINDFLLCKIDNNNSGDFNQALMDLGRTTCKSSNPNCISCPIIMFCKAHVNNNVNSFPIKKNYTIKQHHHVAIGVIWNKNKILVSKRKNEGMLGGLWEFPGGKLKLKETAQQCVIREIKEELDVDVLPVNFIDSINHSYSHFSITLNAYHCKYIKGSPRALGCSEFRWIHPNHLKLLAFPVSSQKIFNKILHYFNS